MVNADVFAPIVKLISLNQGGIFRIRPGSGTRPLVGAYCFGVK